MTRGRRIATGLAAIAGGLLVVVLALALGLGRGYTLASIDADDVPPPVEVRLTAEMPRMPPAPTYGDILVRPLFNESRQPEAVPEASAVAATQPASPLNVTLSGIILTRDAEIALVTYNATQQTERVRVGQPLSGDQSAWTLAELRPRAAVFDGGPLGRQELELMTDTAGSPAVVSVQAPPQDGGGVNPTGPTTMLPGGISLPSAAPVDGQAAAPAAGTPSEEEIRKRIEERRRQLREEAQRIMQQQQSAPGG